MPMTLYPTRDYERDMAAAALRRALGDADTASALHPWDKAPFLAACDAYAAAGSARCACLGTKGATSAAMPAAERAFDRDLRLLVAALLDEKGRTQPRLLAELLDGKLPSQVIAGTCAEKVRRAGLLLERLPGHPELRGDPRRVSALAISTAALEAAVIADREADLALQTALSAYREARLAFDKAYRRLVVMAQLLQNELFVLRHFPRFRRKKPATAANREARAE